MIFPSVRNMQYSSHKPIILPMLALIVARCANLGDSHFFFVYLSVCSPAIGSYPNLAVAIPHTYCVMFLLLLCVRSV